MIIVPTLLASALAAGASPQDPCEHHREAAASVAASANAYALVRADARTPQQWIASLEAVPPDWLEDMHGNAHRDAQRLMAMRFDATCAVIAKIEALERSGTAPDLRRVLYRVLGTVKDPAAIYWLRRKLEAGQHEVLVHDWLAWWQDLYPDYGAWPWLTGRDAWLDFLEAGLREDPDPAHAREWLHVLSGFADARVVAVFEARREAAAPAERLLIEAYLADHGRTPDAPAIEAALAEFKTPSDQDEWVDLMARRLRHPAFVPWLIARLETSSSQGFDPSYTLGLIACRRDIESASDWRAWHAEHGDEDRRTWLLEQQERLSELLRADEAAAVAWFDKAAYVLSDIELLPYVRSELLPRRAFASHVAGWINLTYRPAYRARLAPVARKVAEAGGLEDWAKALLIGRGYVTPHPVPTWDGEVFRMNSRL